MNLYSRLIQIISAQPAPSHSLGEYKPFAATGIAMLAEILSSRIRAEIFRLLFAATGEELHMREIQRRSCCAIGTIQMELKKLKRLGLLLERKEANRLYFRANRDHMLYQNIRSLVARTNGAPEKTSTRRPHRATNTTTLLGGSR